nr:hypothetical protein [Tanacetum cinerariifolium]
AAPPLHHRNHLLPAWLQPQPPHTNTATVATTAATAAAFPAAAPAVVGLWLADSPPPPRWS